MQPLSAAMEFPSQRHDVQRPLSQSEREWMYAKRALASRDDPEEVIRRIADFRSSEKIRSGTSKYHGSQRNPEPTTTSIAYRRLCRRRPTLTP